jgi:hypothetical protein
MRETVTGHMVSLLSRPKAPAIPDRPDPGYRPVRTRDPSPACLTPERGVGDKCDWRGPLPAAGRTRRAATQRRTGAKRPLRPAEAGLAGSTAHPPILVRPLKRRRAAATACPGQEPALARRRRQRGAGSGFAPKGGICRRARNRARRPAAERVCPRGRAQAPHPARPRRGRQCAPTAPHHLRLAAGQPCQRSLPKAKIRLEGARAWWRSHRARSRGQREAPAMDLVISRGATRRARPVRCHPGDNQSPRSPGPNQLAIPVIFRASRANFRIA